MRTIAPMSGAATKDFPDTVWKDVFGILESILSGIAILGKIQSYTAE